LPTSARLGCVVVLLVAPLVGGCSHDYAALDGTSADGGCSVGDETCVCFPNSTCQAGLTCASDRCVRVGGTGTGGSVGNGGTVGTGGSPGNAGTVGTGGSIGTGGTTGTGGSGPPANNQIVNGDFHTGTSGPWHVTNGSGTISTDATGVVTNGQFCVTESNTYTAFNIGWPAASSPVAVLQASTTYELYYQISTTTALYSFSAKVGSAPGGTGNLTDLMTTGNQGEPTAGAGLQTFAFTFVPGADPTAGVVFLLYSGASATTVCIDNVALGTPN
jgi:Carbohydrate binding domain